MKKDCEPFSAPIIRDKEKTHGFGTGAFVPLLCRYRLEPHMKEIIIKSISYIFQGRVVKMFKVIANFKNTIQHVASDNTKASATTQASVLHFHFFPLSCISHYFRFTST